jgi:hypothetical protein
MANSKKQDYLSIRYGKVSFLARGHMAIIGVVAIVAGILLVAYFR